MKKQFKRVRQSMTFDNIASQEISSPAPTKKTLAEWITLLISLGVFGGLVVLIGILWLSAGEKRPANPVIQVKWEQISSHSDQFHVPFDIVNEGDETATQVQVIGELKNKGTIEQSGEQTIDFLSQQETEQGVFVFHSDPRQGDLSIRVANYQ